MRATEAPGPSPEELHVLDYAVYGYLQQGRDWRRGRRLPGANPSAWCFSRNTLVAEYNRTAMAARLPLELRRLDRGRVVPRPAAG